ncbi:MAG: phosphoribosyltransferase family protein, partial [Leuconostoc falkenbergense]
MANKEVLDNASLQRALTRITYEIIERNKGGEDLVLVGIKTRGEFLAHRIADRLEQLEGVRIPVMAIDITNFRDDIPDHHDDLGLNQAVRLNISEKNILLI